MKMQSKPDICEQNDVNIELPRLQLLSPVSFVNLTSPHRVSLEPQIAINPIDICNDNIAGKSENL